MRLDNLGSCVILAIETIYLSVPEVVDYLLNANKERYSIIIAGILPWIIGNKLEKMRAAVGLQHFGPTYISLALGMHNDNVPACACISWK